MPYGGTVDGVGYQWLGQDVRLTGQGGGEYHGSLSVGLQLAGQTAGRRQRTGGPVRRRTAAGRGFHLGPRRLHRRALQSAGADQSSRRLHPARPVHQSRLRAGAGCPAHGRADRAGRGPEPAADRPAGHHRRRRSRIAGRHLHADAVHLRPDARRLPRRDQRRDARPGCCRRAAAAQWLLVHRRPPGQCLGRYRRRRAAPVADQLGPGAAPVLAVQRNGLRRLVAADAARRGQPRALAPADARTLRLLLAKDAPGESFSFAGRADFGRSRRQQRHARGRFHEQLAGRVEITAPGAGRSAGFNGLSLDSGPAQLPGRAAPDGGRHAGRGLPEHRQHCSFPATAPPTSRASRCARAPS